MKKNQICPKCSSTDIATGVELTAGGAHTVHLEICRRQLGGLVQPVEAASKIAACVCRECGFVEIYADAPSQFRSAKA
jgi:predicted nucleic-acid-binding Zn-ribbon protein